MKKIYCYKCGKVVALLSLGSKTIKGLICYCPKCVKPEIDVPDFMREIFKGKI